MFKLMFRGLSKKLVFGCLLFSILLGLGNSLLSQVSMEVIDNWDLSGFNDFFIRVLVLVFVYELFEVLVDMYEHLVRIDIENQDYRQYFNRLYYMKPEVLKKANTGYISGLINKLGVNHEYLIEKMMVDVPAETMFIIYYVFKLWNIYPMLSVWLLFAVVTGSFIRVLLQNVLVSKYSRNLSYEEGCRNRLFTDAVSNMGTVQKMQANKFFMDKAEDNFSKCNKATFKWALSNEIAFISNKLLNYLDIPVFMFLIVYVRGGQLTSYEWALIMIVALKAPHNVRSIAGCFTHYGRWKAQVETLEAICCDENKRKPIYSGDIKSIEISDVDYSYHDEESGNDIRIKIPYFRVHKGDFICISGESGQGKTTLLNILSGEIETGNTVINNTMNCYRPDCVFIAQDTEMFDMSIIENMLLGQSKERHTKVGQLMYCIHKTGLYDWFEKQKDGLDTMLGERGVFVSTGQRQRLNLIRGLLIDDKEVYLLDEPTSNVDAETEEMMVDLIKDYLRGKTVICVTHRPAILKLATKRYVFENNELREKG